MILTTELVQVAMLVFLYKMDCASCQHLQAAVQKWTITESALFVGREAI